jgi:hypothetical protein
MRTAIDAVPLQGHVCDDCLSAFSQHLAGCKRGQGDKSPRKLN